MDEGWDSTHRGRFHWKRLITQTNRWFVELRYVEFRDPRDIADAKASLPERLKAPPAGTHVDEIEAFSLSGAEGQRAHLHVDASSSNNHAPIPLVEQTQWLLRGGRLFWVDCSTPVGKAAICDRFFASFSIAEPPTGDAPASRP